MENLSRQLFRNLGIEHLQHIFEEPSDVSVQDNALTRTPPRFTNPLDGSITETCQYRLKSHDLNHGEGTNTHQHWTENTQSGLDLTLQVVDSQAYQSHCHQDAQKHSPPSTLELKSSVHCVSPPKSGDISCSSMHSSSSLKTCTVGLTISHGSTVHCSMENNVDTAGARTSAHSGRKTATSISQTERTKKLESRTSVRSVCTSVNERRKPSVPNFFMELNPKHTGAGNDCTRPLEAVSDINTAIGFDREAVQSNPSKVARLKFGPPPTSYPTFVHSAKTLNIVALFRLDPSLFCFHSAMMGRRRDKGSRA